jgi:excisionase family DNA binding protein
MRGWFTKKSASQYADVSKRTVHAWIHELGLRHSKVKGTVLIKKSWLDEFLESFEDKGKVDRIVDEVLND